MFDKSTNIQEVLDELYNLWMDIGVIEIGYPPKKAFEFATYQVACYAERHKLDVGRWVAPHLRRRSLSSKPLLGLNPGIE